MYTSMVIAGGAIKVMAVLGIVKYLEEHNLRSNLKTFIGTSAGAIVTLMLSLGYTFLEMKKIAIDALQNKSLSSIDAEGILDIFDNYGLNNGDSLELLFNKLIVNKFNTNNMNFMDFVKQTGKNLVICVSNLSKERHEFFSVDTTPYESVARAVRTSCSIPIMYNPVRMNGDLYLDGGLYNNFPINYCTDNKLQDILGVNIVLRNYQKHDDFLKYVRFIFNSLINKFNTMSINSEDKNIITLEFDDDDNWLTLSEIKLTLEKLEEYIEMGYESAKTNIKI